MVPYLLMFAAFGLAIVMHLLIIAKTGELMGAPVKKLKIGFMLRLFHFYLGRRLIEFRLLPIAGNVIFDGPEKESDRFYQPNSVDVLPAARRIIIAASGCLGLVLASLLLSGSSGLHAFFIGFIQIIKGALSPFNTAHTYLNSFYQYSQVHSFSAIFAIVAAKVAAINLLPMPGSNGWSILMFALRGNKVMPTKFERSCDTGVLISLLIYIGWLVAIGYNILVRV